MLAVHPTVPTTDRSHPTWNLSTAANIVSFHRAISIITDDEKVAEIVEIADELWVDELLLDEEVVWDVEWALLVELGVLDVVGGGGV